MEYGDFRPDFKSVFLLEPGTGVMLDMGPVTTDRNFKEYDFDLLQFFVKIVPDNIF